MSEEYGIWSSWTKKWCFGISEPTKKRAWQALYNRIGKDAYKWRFEIKKIKPKPKVKKEKCKMANEINTKVITGVARLSYANVWEPQSIDGGEPKYSTSILIPKDDKETLRKIKTVVDGLKEQAKAKYNGKLPAKFHTPLRDGDEERPDDEAYANHYFFNASSKSKPGIAKPMGKEAGKTKFVEITDTTEVYSGCYAKVSINFYLFDTKGNKGIAVGLNNIVKVQDGESLGGGRASVNSDFENEDFDDVVDISDDDDFLN